MFRRVLLPRILLSAVMASGCSSSRNVDPASDAESGGDFPRTAITAPGPTLSSPNASVGPIGPADPVASFALSAIPSAPEQGGDSEMSGHANPRIHALRRHVWVRARPSESAPWLGFLGLGGAVTLRQGKPTSGPGCAAFQPVAPRGFVCLDERVTLDSNDPTLRAIEAIAPHLESPWPYQYAESRQTPRYESLPSVALQRRREFQLDQHLAAVAALRTGDFAGEVPPLLRDVDVTPSLEPMPAFFQRLPRVQEDFPILKAGSTLSYVRSFDAAGRTWLITGDGVLVPKDRVAPYARSTFRGVELDAHHTLPMGFVKDRARPQFLRNPDGTFVERGASWPRLASFGLTGEQVEEKGATYLETGQGLWAKASDIVVVRASPETPWNERIEGGGLASGVRWSRASRAPSPGHRRTWVEVSVHEGWLIAYEGTRPVRATLVATGRGEPVRPGAKMLQTSTPPGIFAIQGKYWTSTMAVNSTAHFDVPFAMPYSGAYALHAAYWHDRWGEKVSLGCINLAPIDARWLFLWSEPSIPAGWHGLRVTPETGRATVVVVHA